MAVIAIDLGGTKLASAIVLEDGTVRFTHKNMLAKREGQEVGQLIIENLQRQFHNADYNKIPIYGIGICVPGSVDPTTRRVWCPNIPGWDNYPLEEEISTAFADRHVSVHVDSDRSCYVYGEMWQGNAKNCANVIFIAVGTGIGAGIICDGRALHGANDIIGATGWMALQPPYDHKYDPMGCFEYYASGTGICNRAKDVVRADKRYRGKLRQMPISRITTKAVFTAYFDGDPMATKVIYKAVEMWGMGAANLVSLFNPERIVWGGGVFGPAKTLIPQIYAEATKWAQPLSIKKVQFVHSELMGNSGLLGAAYVALYSDLDKF